MVVHEERRVELLRPWRWGWVGRAGGVVRVRAEEAEEEGGQEIEAEATSSSRELAQCLASRPATPLTGNLKL
jgi:hypothetical protein